MNMKKIIHWEYTKHKGGPLTNEHTPQKTGVAVCGMKFDEYNIKSAVVENINCNNCIDYLKNIGFFDKNVV